MCRSRGTVAEARPNNFEMVCAPSCPTDEWSLSIPSLPSPPPTPNYWPHSNASSWTSKSALAEVSIRQADPNFLYSHRPVVRNRLVCGRSRVRSSRPATFFRGDWSWNNFYGYSLPSANSRRAVVSYWRNKCALSTGKLPSRLAQEQCG